MSDHDAEETRLLYEQRMGTELGRAFYTIMCEVAYLHDKWGDYIALFGTKSERVDLLNRAAPAFFARLQDTLFDDALLHLSRLTDRRRGTLSMVRLVSLVPDGPLKARLTPLLAELDRKVAFCRGWRNRRIAHTDYRLATGRPIPPLPAASRAATREAIETVAGVLNAICQHYCESDLYFRYDENCGALDLVYVLHDGLRMADERNARIVAGNEYRPEDFATPNL